ncbi:MAG: hypothetical protein Q8865_05035 [Bacillota bacterium]|nr:hypothetical protein [Bacillota bacterium]
MNNLLSNSKPAWAKGFTRVMNVMTGFRAVVGQGKTTVSIATSSIYRLLVNGKFAAHGPAVTAHDYYRVDEIDITEYLTKEKNVVVIESVANNVNSFYVLDACPFIQAELVQNEDLLFATGSNRPFTLFTISERVQKVQKYTFQRTFTEVYRMDSRYAEIRENPDAVFTSESEYIYDPVNLMERHVKYPAYHVLHHPFQTVETGRVNIDYDKKEFFNDRGIGPVLQGNYKGYKIDEVEVASFYEWQRLSIAEKTLINAPFKAKHLPERGYLTAEFSRMYTGFIGLDISCRKDSSIMIVFDEMLYNGDVDLTRSGNRCVNVIIYELKAGNYHLESFEPYSVKAVKVVATSGDAELNDIYLREYSNGDTDKAVFECSDNRLNEVFEAGRETFKQNSVDIFLDCPSRERAGWLCDSYFTSRAAAALTGSTLVEDNFIENFILPKSFPVIPEGMLPMCYPCEHMTGNYIPNWALWLIPQLFEYKSRGGSIDIIKRIEPRIHRLFEFFEKYENEFGLLERLDRWVFVEWSQANKYVQDVNFPTNMLYYGALMCAGKLYDRIDYIEKANRIKDAILSISYNGEFFEDNAVRENGKLVLKGNTTEVCQYYAFFFDVAIPDSHPKLWDTLLTKFGPKRDDKTVYPSVYKANAFIGNYMRLEMLSRHNIINLVLDETVDYFHYMAERTGTLWEDNLENKSLNHGFASHVCYTIMKDILGVYSIDYETKKIIVYVHDVPLDYCKGTVPVGDDVISVSWKRRGNGISLSVTPPNGYSVETRCSGNLNIL